MSDPTTSRDAAQALADVSAGRAAARAAAVKPSWFSAGIAVCLGAIIAVTAPALPPIVFAVTAITLLLVEIGLIAAWRRSMTVRVSRRERFRPLSTAIMILVGLLAVAVGAIALLRLPSWPTHTQAWLAPLCGVVVAVVAWLVQRWRSRQWLAMAD